MIVNENTNADSVSSTSGGPLNLISSTSNNEYDDFTRDDKLVDVEKNHSNSGSEKDDTNFRKSLSFGMDRILSSNSKITCAELCAGRNFSARSSSSSEGK